jgi:hypothetical protein
MWIRTYQTKMGRISEFEQKAETALRERICVVADGDVARQSM